MKTTAGKRVVMLLAVGIGLMIVGAAAQQPDDTSALFPLKGNPAARDGLNWERLLARVKRGQGPHAEALARGHSARLTRCARLPLMVLELPGGSDGRAAAGRLSASGLFDYVEPDFKVHVISTPNDPRYDELWGMPKISAPAAWDLQTASDSVVVAVVDTGIWAQHPDLAGNLWADPATGTPGYQYINGVESADPDDDHGHGTHVAGTIGAVGNNGVGVAGVNWSARIAAFKFLGNGGSGYISDAVLCYDKILQLRQQGVNIRVINNSWGGGGYSQAFADALQAATDAGILSVFAAGNNAANADLLPHYPSSYTNLLVSVAASDAADNRAGFSNYGLAGTDIAAPGVSILSTVPTAGGTLADATGYKLLNGTSMAAPHVAGALAALFHRHPWLTPQQAVSMLLDPGSYDALATSAAQTSTGGRLNLYKLLTNPFVSDPAPNHPPAVSGSIAPKYAFDGETVQIGFAGTDPDGDALRFGGLRGVYWLVNRLLNYLPSELTGPASFSAPLLSRPVWLNYVLQANDRRGGTDSTDCGVTLLQNNASPMVPPTGSLTATLVDPATLTYRIDFPITDPDSAQSWFHLTVGNSSFCCYQNSAYVRFDGDWTGRQARITVLGMDSELNETSDSTVISFGPVTEGLAPHAVVSFDATWGEAPLTLHFDATASTDPDSAQLTALVLFIDTYSALAPGDTPRVSLDPGGLSGTLTFPEVGSWFVWVLIRDESGNCDSVAQYVFALPPAGLVANPQAITTPEDTGRGITLTGSSPEGGALTYEVVTGPVHGTLSGSAPDLTYTPAANYNGADSFTFKVGDGAQESPPAEVSITVTPVNDAPVADPQSVTTPEDSAVGITLSGHDVDGDALSYGVVVGPVHGTLSGSAPNLTYTPAANYNGADSFTFKVGDGTQESAPAAVSITVTPVNDAPVADPQSVNTPENSAVGITLSGQDADGDTLSYAVVSGPAHGTLSGSAPDLTYTPAANYYGGDNFTFRASDGVLESAPAAVSITVTPVNDVPVADPQSVATPEDTTVRITLTGQDADGSRLTYEVVVSPAHGTLSGRVPRLKYVPTANYNGDDSFTFKVSNGVLESAPAEVSITVTPVNDAPVANPQAVTTPEDSAVGIALTGQDADGDPLTYAVVVGPAHGALTGTAPNLTYTPAAGYSGADSFTFSVSDGALESAPAVVGITVTSQGQGHPPVADPQSINTLEDNAVGITLTGQDADGDALTYEVVTGPAHGTLSGVAPDLTYTPHANYSGADSFTFRVSDGQTTSPAVAVDVAIVAVNDPPTFNLASRNLNVRRNSGPQTLPGWATDIAPGAPNESGQTVSFNVTSDNPSLLDVQASIDPAGTLTLTPGAAAGVADITVIARDDGGTANGGNDTSSPQWFRIRVR